MKRLCNRLFSFAFPCLFLASGISLFHDRLPFLPSAGALFWTVMISTGIVTASLTAIFHFERIDGKAQFQAFILTFIAAWGIFVFLNKGDFPSRLNPGPEKILMLVCLTMQWFWSTTIAQFFKARELLLQSLENKNDRELHEALNDDGFLLSNVMEDLKGIKSSTITASVILFIFIVILYAFGLQLSVTSLVYIIMFYFLSFIAYTLFGIYQEEQIFAGLGLGPAFSLSGKKFQYALIFLLVCTVLSLILSADRPVIPPTFFLYILGLLAQFMAWLSPKRPRTDQIKLINNDQPPMGSLKDLLGDANGSGWDLRWIYLFFKYTILIGIFAGAAWFLFGSFFKREFRNFLREGKLWKYMKLFFTSARNLAVSMIRRIRSIGSGNDSDKITATHSRADYEKSIKERTHRGKSREKKIEIGKLTEQFLRIVDWGDERGIAYSPVWAPLEYAEILSRSSAAAADDLARAATLFEKALYSPSLLDTAEKDLFIRSVEAVLCTGSAV